MSYINGSDYNVTINTPRYILAPMTSKDTSELLTLCKKEGFNYPYIHSHQKTQHLSLEERVEKYAALGDQAIDGKFGRTLLQTIHTRENADELLGISVLFATEAKDPLFKNPNPDEEWEIGYFVDVQHQGKGIATEAIYFTTQYGFKNWGLKGLWASVEPTREASMAIAKKLGLEIVEKIPAGSERVPYNDMSGNPAARNIFHTPQGWTLPALKF